jgi:hypothetical protein
VAAFCCQIMQNDSAADAIVGAAVGDSVSHVESVLHIPLAQSLLPAHCLPGAHRGQPLAPPQSTSVSRPPTTLFLHEVGVGAFVGVLVGARVGAFVGDFVGIGVSQVLVSNRQLPLLQSVFNLHFLPAPHFEHPDPPSIPPQSTSVSAPPSIPSSQT